MIYYCIHKDKCPFKECLYQGVELGFLSGNEKNLITREFTCIQNKKARLISDERIICDRYSECIVNCLLKTIYITIDNFQQFFGYKLPLQTPCRCRDTGNVIFFSRAGKIVENHTGNYTSIWD